MTPAQARQLVEGLAGGLDATTGEVLPEGGPLSQPHVIRALFLAARALEQMAVKAARPLPGNAGKPWGEEEDQRLAAAFDAGTPVTELARVHERSRGAITSRLVRPGRLPAASAHSPGALPGVSPGVSRDGRQAMTGH